MSISTIPPDPVSIVISGEQSSPIVITTSDTCKIFSVNGKVGFVVIDKNDIGLPYVENISILGTSGYLQGQINSLDLNYASQSEFNNLSGQLLSSGLLLKDIINSLSGSLNNTGNYLLYQINDIKNWTGSSSLLYYPLNSNPSGYLTNDDITGFITGFNSGDYLLKSETGQFYASNNPLGFITSAALSPYMTGFNSGDYILKTDTGNFYPISNPSGYITGVNLSNYVTGSVVRPSDTGIFYTRDNLSGFITGSVIRPSDTGIFYPIYNPSGYITGIDLSNYITGDVVRPIDTGIFYTKDNPSGFITGIYSGDFALQTSLYQSGDSLWQRDISLSGSLNTTGVNLYNQIQQAKILAIAYAIAL